MKLIKNWEIPPTMLFFGVALVIVGIVLLILDIPYLGREEFAENILIEAHGLFFDLFVFGVILTLYENFRDKKDRMDRYKEEIEDYCGWNEKEAVFRVVGIIKRLNREGQTSINLRKCYLEGASLKKASLSGADLSQANLKNAALNQADLRQANLNRTNLAGANLSDANLSEANLIHANLEGANLLNAILAGTKVESEDWLTGLKRMRVIGTEEMETRYTLEYEEEGVYQLIEKAK